MENRILEERLDELRQQAYPLAVSNNAAEALNECFRRIMEAVPEDDRVFVRADYDLATSAIFHPAPTDEQ